MSDRSLSALESHAKTGTDPSATANSGAADANSNNQGEGEGEGPKGDSIEGNGGEGEGRGDNDIDSGEGPIDRLQDDMPAPAPGPVVRKSMQMMCEVLIERKTTSPAQKPKAAPQKKPRFTVTTCQMGMKYEEGGGLCDKDLDPETEVGRYKRCKMHREIEAQRQRAVRYQKLNKATEGGGKRKREGGRKLRGSKVRATLCSQSLCVINLAHQKRSKVQESTSSESGSDSDLDDSEGEEENAKVSLLI